MTREPIYAAIFAFFAGLTAGGSPLFKFATRKAVPWENVDASQQPALLQMQGRETAVYRKGMPTVWRCQIELLLYVHTGALEDPDITPAQLLNPLLDAIEASIAVDDQFNDACTLGGLVSHCAINGPIEMFEGNVGSEAVAVVPIEFLTTP